MVGRLPTGKNLSSFSLLCRERDSLQSPRNRPEPMNTFNMYKVIELFSLSVKLVLMISRHRRLMSLCKRDSASWRPVWLATQFGKEFPLARGTTVRMVIQRTKTKKYRFYGH